MLVVKATPLICFLCVGFSWNWLNADKGQNCEKVDRSIPSIFRVPVVFRKYCYLGNSKQVPPILDSSTVDPFAIKALSCMTLYNAVTWISWAWLRLIPTDTDGLLNSLTPLNYNFIQKPSPSFCLSVYSIDTIV